MNFLEEFITPTAFDFERSSWSCFGRLGGSRAFALPSSGVPLRAKACGENEATMKCPKYGKRTRNSTSCYPKRVLTNHLCCAYNRDMAYIRAKKFNGRTYYYLVEGKREGKKVSQKVLKYLGTEKPSPEEVKRLLKEMGK